VHLLVHVQQTIEEGQRAADAEHQVAGRKGRIANRKGWTTEYRVHIAECSEQVKQGEQNWTDSEQVRQVAEQLSQDHRSKENRKEGRTFKSEIKQNRARQRAKETRKVSKRD
jgi:hypothetical protein